ncbi:flagellar biosynthesis protein [Maritimibacter fusiformis]|uniref:FliH/SctL family protein n=1 Tax=Maritimibacter fusiformis TaxID=2603819 RepID=UPI001FE6B959|nr:flagellar biosynthesis protein [Maritimibacter fusiformis]
MTSARLNLEDFSAFAASHEAAPRATGAASPAPASQADAEAARLEGYEAGYRAGWDDAARAEAEDQSRIGAEFARNLQDLGFTFHEARAHVMQALEPLLTGMVERVLPRLVSETIGQTIVEELLPLATAAAGNPIEVVVSPANRPVVEEMLARSDTVPFTLVEEPTLAEGQVYLRSGALERQIDFTEAVDRIGAAIGSLYQLNEKAFQHG